jgi:hypothetical protein
MFYFKTVKLGFDPEFLGRSHLVAAIADLAGGWYVSLSFVTS